MFYLLVKSQNCFFQCDENFCVQVVASALEARVFILTHSKYQVSGYVVRVLLTLALKENLLSVTHSPFNIYIHSLCFCCNPFASAVWAIRAANFSLTGAFIALHLLLKLETTHLNPFESHSLTFANRACLKLSVFIARAATVRADNILSDSVLFNDTIVQVL
jgi:hypothetical protein